MNPGTLELNFKPRTPMAKQVGPLFFTGTVDGIIFYKLGDNYYMRSKGSYKSGKQMRKDRTYARTMQQADRFGAASNLLRGIYYRHLPKAVRKHGLYGKLTGMINKWLYAGKSKEEVQELLLAYCQQLAATAKPAAPKENAKPSLNEQPSTLNVPPPSNNSQPSSVNYQLSSTNTRPKHPRYLSRWKVKRNGQLHVPSTANCSLVSDERGPAAGANRRRRKAKRKIEQGGRNV